MEIGSFLSLDLRPTGEYFSGESNIARLNSARAGIYHACRLYNCHSIHLPYYLCPSVRTFLENHSINVKYYNINSGFEPIERAINVYSPRKFFGVPDGCYVIGKNAKKYVNQYKQDFASDTSSFLFKRIEYSLNDTYRERMINEKRIDESDILRMSSLSYALLGSIDYKRIKETRRKNFNFAHKLFKKINKIDPYLFIDKECNPLVYPLVIEDATMHEKLKANKIYTGRWWNQVLLEVQDNTHEAWLSKYMIPVPIDQRYGKDDLLHISDTISGIHSDGKVVSV